MMDFKFINELREAGMPLTKIREHFYPGIQYETLKSRLRRHNLKEAEKEEQLTFDNLNGLKSSSVIIDDCTKAELQQAMDTDYDLERKTKIKEAPELTPEQIADERKLRFRSNDTIVDWNGARHFKIGVVSDSHIGNICTQMTFLNRAYDIFEELDITDVYHCGDILDGWYPNRSDQIYELFAHGADRQIDYVCDHYPMRENITTHFITGNHDFTFVRNTG